MFVLLIDSGPIHVVISKRSIENDSPRTIRGRARCQFENPVAFSTDNSLSIAILFKMNIAEVAKPIGIMISKNLGRFKKVSIQKRPC